MADDYLRTHVIDGSHWCTQDRGKTDIDSQPRITRNLSTPDKHCQQLEAELARLRMPGETFRLHRSELLEFLARLDRAEAQVTELQRRNTELVEEAREARAEAERLNAIAYGECERAREFEQRLSEVERTAHEPYDFMHLVKRIEALEGDGK